MLHSNYDVFRPSPSSSSSSPSSSFSSSSSFSLSLFFFCFYFTLPFILSAFLSFSCPICCCCSPTRRGGGRRRRRGGRGGERECINQWNVFLPRCRVCTGDVLTSVLTNISSWIVEWRRYLFFQRPPSSLRTHSRLSPSLPPFSLSLSLSLSFLTRFRISFLIFAASGTSVWDSLADYVSFVWHRGGRGEEGRQKGEGRESENSVIIRFYSLRRTSRVFLMLVFRRFETNPSLSTVPHLCWFGKAPFKAFPGRLNQFSTDFQRMFWSVAGQLVVFHRFRVSIRSANSFPIVWSPFEPIWDHFRSISVRCFLVIVGFDVFLEDSAPIFDRFRRLIWGNSVDSDVMCCILCFFLFFFFFFFFFDELVVSGHCWSILGRYPFYESHFVDYKNLWTVWVPFWPFQTDLVQFGRFLVQLNHFQNINYFFFCFFFDNLLINFVAEHFFTDMRSFIRGSLASFDQILLRLDRFVMIWFIQSRF